MAGSTSRLRLPLTFRLLAVLVLAALALSLVVAWRASEWTAASTRATLCQQTEARAAGLAAKATEHLERGDELRLALLSAAALDAGTPGGRALILDAEGVVRIDTGLAQGGRKLQVLSHGGPLSRTLDDDVYEAIAPCARAGVIFGEVRLQAQAGTPPLAFAWGLFGLVFLGCLSLVSVAVAVVHGWLTRVGEATSALRRMCQGEFIARPQRPAAGVVAHLQEAVGDVARTLEEGLRNVDKNIAELALALVDQVERRDQTPPGHGARTARYALVLAERLDLLPADREELSLAARLHDLGKVAVRPALLEKAGPLDDEERASFRQHPDRGASFLQGIPTLRRIALMVRHHHEKYGGGGYPDGLRGDRIPIGARILAIADAYDVLTSAKLDGPAMAWPDALDRMREDRGEHFDPWLFDLFEEEIRRAPIPEQPIRYVMISTAGVVPYKVADEQASREGEDEDQAAEFEELEVVPDGQDGEGVP
jgi:hypothetical protein